MIGTPRGNPAENRGRNSGGSAVGRVGGKHGRRVAEGTMAHHVSPPRVHMTSLERFA